MGVSFEVENLQIFDFEIFGVVGRSIGNKTAWPLEARKVKGDANEVEPDFEVDDLSGACPQLRCMMFVVVGFGRFWLPNLRSCGAGIVRCVR